MKIIYSFEEFAKLVVGADPGLFPGYQIEDINVKSYEREITLSLVPLEDSVTDA